MNNEIKLYLIRHGKTYCNEKNLYCGKSDVELTENGINELKEFLKNNTYPRCDFYFTSGAKRANQTLKILCKEKSYAKLDKFFEYNFGDFELKSYEELKLLNEYKEWLEDEEEKIKCPNGESKREFRKRIIEGFNELIEYCIINNIKTALGVTHGGTIGMIIEMLYDNSKKFYEWQPKNGEGYELTIRIKDKNEYEIEKVVGVLND